MRAGRFLARKVPNPVIWTLPPRLSSEAINPLAPKSNSITRAAWVRGRFARLASVSIS